MSTPPNQPHSAHQGRGVQPSMPMQVQRSAPPSQVPWQGSPQQAVQPQGAHAGQAMSPDVSGARANIARPGDIFVAQNRPLNPLGSQRIRITNALVYVEKGRLWTNAQQLPLAMVTDVDAFQNMTQKARGVGSVRVVVARAYGPETILIEDFDEFRQIVDIVNELARRARLAEHQFRNTQNINYSGQPPMMGGPAVLSANTVVSPPPQPPQPLPPDPIDQLERLGKLRAAGVMSDEEFAAKKAQWLSRM